MTQRRLASLGSVMLLLVGAPPLVFGHMMGLRDEWVDLCGTGTSLGAKCNVEPPSSESCSVYNIPKENCFVTFGCMDNKTFNVNEHFKESFDLQNNITNITILNNTEKRLLITTMQPDEIWWQVDLPDGGQNITITGLNGHLNETNPITKPALCTGCPPPIIKYIAQPKMHRFKMMVSEETRITNVSISVSGSNETGISVDSCSDTKYTYDNRVYGMVEEELLIHEMYSTDFCFVVMLYFSNTSERGYRCHAHVNMIEPPFTPIQTSIEVPNWWVVVLGVVLICLVIGSVIPLAIHKGLLRVPCWRSNAASAARTNKRSAEDYASCGDERCSCQPFLRADSVAPSAFPDRRW